MYLVYLRDLERRFKVKYNVNSYFINMKKDYISCIGGFLFCELISIPCIVSSFKNKEVGIVNRILWIIIALIPVVIFFSMKIN